MAVLAIVVQEVAEKAVELKFDVVNAEAMIDGLPNMKASQIGYGID